MLIQKRLLWQLGIGHLGIQFGHTMFCLSDDKAIPITSAPSSFIESAI